MSSQNHNDRLLDLLYGELSPSEAEELRRAIDEDEELANSWRELQQAHQEVQAHLPPPEKVPTSVQDAIMAAAREHHSGGEPRRRAPVNPGKKGLWGSMVTAGTLQSGLGVAVVLIGCALVINFLYSQTGGFEDPADEVASISVGHQSSTYPAPSGTAHAEATLAQDLPEVLEEAEEEAAEAEMAQALIGGIEEADEEAQSQEPSSPASDLGAMARLEERQESTRSRAPARPTPEPSSAPEPSAAPESNDYGGLGLSGAGRGGGGTRSAASAPRQRRAAPRPQPQAEAEPQQQESPALFDAPVQRRTQDRSAPSQDNVAIDAVEEEEDSAELDAESEVEADSDDSQSLVAQAEQAIEDDEWDRASTLLDAALDDESLSDDDRERVHSLRRRAVRRQSIDAYDASERPDSIESETADFEPADVFTR